jgi:hypothetical protein
MKIGLLRNLLKTAGLLSMFEGKADRSTDEIDPSIIDEITDSNTVDKIEDQA